MLVIIAFTEIWELNDGKYYKIACKEKCDYVIFGFCDFAEFFFSAICIKS